MADKTALITGASSGIGFELAKQFADHGYDLVVAAEDAVLVAKRIHVEPVQADLRSAEDVDRLYQDATAGGSPVDAAALNAGVGRPESFLDSPLDDDLSIVDLNIRSTVNLATVGTAWWRRRSRRRR
jgi:short-subunit dehydrogenase